MKFTSTLRKQSWMSSNSMAYFISHLPNSYRNRCLLCFSEWKAGFTVSYISGQYTDDGMLLLSYYFCPDMDLRKSNIPHWERGEDTPKKQMCKFYGCPIMGEKSVNPASDWDVQSDWMEIWTAGFTLSVQCGWLLLIESLNQRCSTYKQSHAHLRASTQRQSNAHCTVRP